MSLKLVWYHMSAETWAGIAQSVQRLATGWTVRGSNPPIPVAEQSKARVCCRLLTGVLGSNSAGDMDVCVVGKDKKAKCRTIKTKTQVRMKYRVQETNKNSGEGEIFRTRSHRPWDSPNLLYNGYRVHFS